MDRMKKVVTVSIIGILVNVALGVIKIIVGNAANSVAVTSDAVNNFADSISSLVTIITMIIVGKGATRKHPFGFGRVEYFSSIIISVLVLFTGGEFMVESVKHIIHPAATSYGTVALILLVVAILAKIGLGLFTKHQGKTANSPNLVASGQDALSDAILTTVTLVGALLSRFAHWNIDGWIGAIVSIFVLKSGLEILVDVINKLLGERPDAELGDMIMKEITATPGIVGAYDLILHNYGPNIFIGNVNVELDEQLSIRDAYEIVKPLSIKISDEYGVFMYFGFYAVNTTDKVVMKMNQDVKGTLMKDHDVLQVHAFYVNKAKKFMSFDVVLDFNVKDQLMKEKKIRDTVHAMYPDYEVEMIFDKDYTLSRPKVKGEAEKEVDRLSEPKPKQ